MGELSLDGRIRPCTGILSMITAARQCGVKMAVVPAANLREAEKVTGIKCYGLQSLKDAVRLLEGRGVSVGITEQPTQSDPRHETVDFADVRGQRELLEAVIIAAAGGHNLLMIGEPGCGKSMIASRIPGILPEMTEAESLEVTRIQSIAGNLIPGEGLVKIRPFRAPHHNVSLNALIGGGTYAQPGEVSLAHGGILDAESTSILKEQCEKYEYSARVIHKLLRMARTAADISQREKIGKDDIIIALSLRELDKSNSKMYTV